MSVDADRYAQLPTAIARYVDPRHWPLALRVVVVTIALSIVAMLTVGAYLSSVIADGLYEQRRDRVLEESVEVRDELSDTMGRLSGATSTQQQDTAVEFVQGVGGQGDSARREAALVPVETSGAVAAAASDRTVFDTIDTEFQNAVAEQPDTVVWKSVADQGSPDGSQPALLVGTRVAVPGSGTYDLFLVYSLQEEQETLAFVQRVILGGGGV